MTMKSKDARTWRKALKEIQTKFYTTLQDICSMCITLWEESNECTEAAEMLFLIGENSVTFPDKETSEDIRMN
jgi:RNase H-fold protein (predicted Holliday junction resolvase)